MLKPVLIRPNCRKINCFMITKCKEVLMKRQGFIISLWVRRSKNIRLWFKIISHKNHLRTPPKIVIFLTVLSSIKTSFCKPSQELHMRVWTIGPTNNRLSNHLTGLLALSTQEVLSVEQVALEYQQLSKTAWKNKVCTNRFRLKTLKLIEIIIWLLEPKTLLAGHLEMLKSRLLSVTY